MSFVVRVYDNPNKYFNENDNIKQQLSDCVIRNLIDDNNREIIGSWDYGLEIVNAINTSNILGFQLTLTTGELDNITYYTIKKLN
jgi:hypothetical protein